MEITATREKARNKTPVLATYFQLCPSFRFLPDDDFPQPPYTQSRVFQETFYHNVSCAKS